MESKDEMIKSQIAIRCAKAGILLHALKSPRRTSRSEQKEEKEMMTEEMKREIVELKMELAKERVRSKRIKLCGLMEFALQVMVVLFLSTFFLIVLLMSP